MFATTDVYDRVVETPRIDWGKRGVAKHLSQAVPHHHHLSIPKVRDKKEPTELSPVKKRVKEGTPPLGTINHSNLIFYHGLFSNNFIYFFSSL